MDYTLFYAHLINTKYALNSKIERDLSKCNKYKVSFYRINHYAVNLELF